MGYREAYDVAVATFRESYGWSHLDPVEFAPQSIVFIHCCDTCGGRFVTRQERRSVCDACKLRKRKQRSQRRRKVSMGDKTCRGCGRPFSVGYGDLRRFYCSSRCRAKHLKAKHGRSCRSRARRYGVAYVPGISIRKLLGRDNRVCGICHGSIPKVRYPHPLSPSIDHIVPLSKGGEHTWDNVQAAHFRCNSRKGSE